MRTLVLLIAVAMPVSAQDPSAAAAAKAACGPNDVKFEVQPDRSPHPVTPPEAGKALLYVIQDVGARFSVITTRTALDGAWIGANHHNSYLSFAVAPGEHHLCAMWQSHLGISANLIGLAHFTAEAGKVYYFRTRPLLGRSETFLDLDPIDSDQGRLLVALYPLSVSHPRK